MAIDRFDRATESFIHYNSRPDDPHSLSGRQVRAIEEDRLRPLPAIRHD